MKCRKCRGEIADNSKYCNLCGAKQDVKQNTKSRGNGQGSVYQLPNKKWIARKTIGWYMKGEKACRKTVSKSGFRTKKEALEALATLGNEPRRVASVTFAKLYEMWLPTHNASKSTLNCYKSAYKYFEKVYFYKLPDITVDDLQACIDDCPKGKRTKQDMKTLCGLLYKYAIPRNLATLNMAEYISVHAESGEAKAALPDEAVQLLAANVNKVPGADYVYCQCYLGFRPSELLALTIQDYDPERKTFTGGAKTEAGKNRIVPVAEKIQPIIDRLTAGKTEGYVFCGASGAHMSINAYRDLFYSVLESCGIENPIIEANGVTRRTYTPHSCRHTFATMMKRVPGADKDKLELIGHTSGVMLRHYQEAPIDDLRKIVNAM